MAIWKDDDPDFNIGYTRLSFLLRRVYRLAKLEEKRPGKFTKQLLEAKKEYEKEFDFSWRIDLL